MKTNIQTAERVSQQDISDNYVYQRSVLAYVKAASIISGKVLEIGTGSGYGIDILADRSDYFLTIDKFASRAGEEAAKKEHIEFRQMNVPPLEGIPDNHFDFVVSFQVIEHIQNDGAFVAEIHRVLKPGGKFIVTTPNKKMSITRNPWHIREYTIDELDQLLKRNFSLVDKQGVFGNEVVQKYYEENKASVRRITRFDVFNLQYRLPRQLLQIPYDILNRRNRNKLSDKGSHIKMEDYSVSPAKEGCFDLFYIATK